MSKEALVSAIKAIVSLARAKEFEASFDAYAQLFASPEFRANRPEDQRQALRLLLFAKRAGRPSERLLNAYESAVAPLTELVSSFDEPEDYEMLGLCHEALGHAESAENLYRHALRLERLSEPASDRAARLMGRISSM